MAATAFAENILIISSIFLISTVYLVVSIPVTTVESAGEEKYSAAPNNTPISKVYIFGRPIYIREPFVIPQRNVSDNIDFSKLFDQSKLRKNRASYTEEQGRQGNQPQAAQYNTNSYQNGYKQAGDEYADEYPWAGKYPLRQCYTESSGYMCCNLHLEKVINNATQKMKESKACNLQKMTTMLADVTEDVFGTDFEAIAAVGDFASKIHFYSDYVCKMQRDGRTILVYATPSRHNGTGKYSNDRNRNGNRNGNGNGNGNGGNGNGENYLITPYTL
ncbi:unnamed protein product [Caenorhabditis nigoni]